jgi:predicted Zn-dependent peptidase
MSDCSILDVFAMVQPRDVSRALEMMLTTLNRFAASGLDPVVFEEARQRLIRSLDTFEDNPLELCNFLAFSPVEADVLSATPRHYRRQLEAFTLAEANAIAADLLKPERRVCVLLGPAGFFTRWRAKRVLAAKTK